MATTIIEAGGKAEFEALQAAWRLGKPIERSFDNLLYPDPRARNMAQRIADIEIRMDDIPNAVLVYVRFLDRREQCLRFRGVV